mgnify:CR=1 FL=1
MGLAEFLALARRDRWLLVSAMVLVLLARILLRATGVDRTRWAVTGVARRLPPWNPLEESERVSWAVNTASNVAPVSTPCLVEAIAAQAMFERYDIDSMLRLGVAGGESFRAHAWVEQDGEVVVGGHPDLEAFEPLER